jgi:hypothetical protein
MLTYIVNGYDVRMVAEPSHGSSFTVDTGSRGIIQFLGLDEGKGHISIKWRIMDEVDLLLAPFTKELLDLITAIGK